MADNGIKTATCQIFLSFKHKSRKTVFFLFFDFIPLYFIYLFIYTYTTLCRIPDIFYPAAGPSAPAVTIWLRDTSTFGSFSVKFFIFSSSRF